MRRRPTPDSFDTETFAATVEAAGIRRHLDARGAHLPAKATIGDAGAGFAEVGRRALLDARWMTDQG